MLYIRVVKTGSGASSVQIVYYINRKRIVYKHIGSGRTDEQITELKIVAQDFIDNYIPPLPLIEPVVKFDNLLYIDRCDYLGIYYTLFYEVITELIFQFGLGKIKNSLLLDLVVIRIFEPASKLRSIELLETYFGIKHLRKNYYKSTSQWLALKTKTEASIVDFVRQNYGLKYDLLFYDVTTLYFETFEEDELRKNGFSKDNKSQQPQILIGLMVSEEGFPISYEVFKGNTFEGHTIIPVVQKFIDKYNVKDFIVVADAAMISSENIEHLLQNNINYIVGARLANLSEKIIKTIDQKIIREDGKSIRIKTNNGFLICSYSSERYRKDKYEMNKQIHKALAIIEAPSKSKKVKFIKSTDSKHMLNEGLIEKTTKLLGIKGYYTNLDERLVSNNTIIERYHELYKVEHAFRISKNDLQTRPIYHFKEDPIQLHILICFISLAISKHIELKTNVSIRKFITECKKITDARLLNKITNKEIKIRTKYNEQILNLISKLNLSH